jgi:hypothetical protein
MQYQISDPLSIRADVSLLLSPFGSLSSAMNNKAGMVFLHNAEVDYKPSKDFGITLQFQRLPADGAAAFGDPSRALFIR